MATIQPLNNGAHVPKLLEFFLADEGELSRHDADAIDRMCRSLKRHGQMQPVLALETGLLISGHGRLQGAKQAGIPTLDTVLYPADTPKIHFASLRNAENTIRTEYCGYRKFMAALSIIQDNPTLKQQDVADELCVSPAMVTMLLSPLKCIDAWREALKENKVTLSDCYKASRLERDKQTGFLNLMLSGGKGEKKPNNPTVRQDKVKIYAGDIQLALSGAGMTLDGVADALSEAIKEVRRAREQSLDIKAFNACQTAKKGGGK